jgi:hypothetical protein
MNIVFRIANVSSNEYWLQNSRKHYNIARNIVFKQVILLV